ncbi:phosphoesterase [Niabella ginsenosidivorans]|uniref:Phosphoesterase n=1 Tax=Niabella ginsenosidivorans TaxID=1176587 RepID=A0A1A9I3N4_9BACT|nr:ligase-associated DNA damage response endonuclease PdeM [Niabella ginsenosidivorans]ANH81925.1 phosphoesterase [Niabella ginsenosidivorans]
MPGTPTKELLIKEELFILSACRAVYWPAQKMLILADLHLGKTGYFRQHGIPVSRDVLQDDLKRLSYLIGQFEPEQVLVAGDLFHHQFNRDILVFNEWRNAYRQLAFLLVPGNHDRHLKIDYSSLAITKTTEEYFVKEFRFIHEMKAAHEDHFSISGHLHPGYTIKGKARQAVCLPCFINAEDYLILPAFSGFTGLFTGYEQQSGAAYFVISGESLFEFR